jgi:hypothetical protein
MENTDADAVDIYEELGLSEWPDVLDREAALDSIAAFYQIVGPDSDDLALTITSDFENEVKSYLEPAWAAAFMQDRGPYGRCMAKTMTKDDGSQVVIADVHLFLKDAPSPEQTFRHEALHVLIHRRGESLNRSRDTIANHDGMHPDVVALAGIAAEEYRVDRCVMPSRDELWSSFEALCIAGHNAIRHAAVAYFYDHDVQAIWDAVMRAFAPLTVQAAYAAAWINAEERDIPRLKNAALGKRMLGESWSEVIGAFRALPLADVETSRDDLNASVIQIAHRFDDWLGEIGFGCEQLDDGSLYFHVYEHKDWATRALVADGPVA